ncbi:7152_t:CDS:1, partial [Funneliformis geosporum]
LNEKIKENDEASDTKAYGEKKEEIETQKKRSASEDPNKYRRNVAIPGIKNLMAKYDIKENELDDDAKKD